MVEIENILFPEISLGTSPFLGAGQFEERSLMYYSRLFNKPENMVRIIIKSIKLGITGVQAIACDVIVNAIIKAEDLTGKQINSSLVIGLEDWQKELKYADLLKSRIIYIHARIADSKNISLLKEIINYIRSKGLIPGCATHAPWITLPYLDDSGLDIATYLVPINKIGRFMGKDPKKILSIIESSPKVIFAKKILAAGKLIPQDALEYIGSIKKIKGLAIGIATEKEAEETFSIAKRIFKG